MKSIATYLRIHSFLLVSLGVILTLSFQPPSHSKTEIQKSNIDETKESPKTSLEYPLQEGYIDHWLVAGPQIIRIEDVSPHQGKDDAETKNNILKHFYKKESGITNTPAEGQDFNLQDSKLIWKYRACDVDHVVSVPGGGGCVYFKTWAYSQIFCAEDQKVDAKLSVHGPVDIWVNGSHLLRKDDLSIFVPTSHTFSIQLHQGVNEILVRFEVVKIRVGTNGMSLGLSGLPQTSKVYLPTTLPETADRLIAENAISAAFMDRDRFDAKGPTQEAVVQWANHFSQPAKIKLILQSAKKEIIDQREITAKPDTKTSYDLRNLKNGKHTVTLIPLEIQNEDLRKQLTSTLSFSIYHSNYADKPYGTFSERKQEALEKASSHPGLYGEFAKMELGKWDEINPDPFFKAIQKINQRKDTSDFDLTGLLGAMLRYGKNPSFPVDVKDKLEDCILNFKYWADEPGKDVMWFWSENHQIAFHACEVMAGQLYPEQFFTNAKQNGSWHREKGEKLSLKWLKIRASHGFHEWDSNTYYAVDLMALAHLADLSESEEVRKLASTVLSKMLLDIALNSYKGIFGSTHARTYPGNVKFGQNEGTSGAARLFWGLGNFTDEKAYVSLALMKNYPFPAVIEKIATDSEHELWNRQRNGGTLDPQYDYFDTTWEINKVTYRTPDFMLCSAQDFKPGDRGNMQHIWQATLGTEAVVFVNHPPFMSESGSPNFWVGNLVLPRVAQWKDVLIDIRDCTGQEGMGFTHAYFPKYAFDECMEENGWVFARKENGYLALTSQSGIAWTQTGPYAQRELRSRGVRDIWICQVGSKGKDGSFQNFQKNILRSRPNFKNLAVEWKTPRGDEISFGWKDPFRVNGREVPLKDFNHYDNSFCTSPYPSNGMKIQFGNESTELSVTGIQ